MGDKKFGNKAKKIFKSESKLGGISDFLSDSDNNGNTEMQNSEITNNRKYGNTEIRNNDTTENLEGGTSPAMVRHELHLSEELSEKIRKFQFFNKENNKTRLITSPFLYG